MEDDVIEKTWEEFQSNGLLWWINRSLHLFGWSIVFELDGQGKIEKVYPARVKFRGFAEDIETKGFECLSEYLKKNGDNLLKEAKP